MSYINLGRDKDSLPAINSARRIKALEEELHAYRIREATQPTQPTGFGKPGILKHDGSWRAVSELQDQVKTFREELMKKDSLIQHLVSVEGAPKIPRAPDAYKYDSIYVGERSVHDSGRSELATIQVKYERAQAQIHELKAELEAKDIKLREFHNFSDAARKNEEQLNAMVASMQAKLAEYESRAGSFETVANRGEITISALQRENREANDKIVELEARLRKQLEVREETEAKAHGEQRRLLEFLSQVSSLLMHSDELANPSPSSVDLIIRKLTDLVQENAMLKGKILTMGEHLNENQLETKASRETIMRLVSEVGREQKVATRYSSDIENIRLERDNALAARIDLEREIGLLRDRLEANQRALDATKSELDLRQERFSSLDRNFQHSIERVRSTSTELDLFREKLANILVSVFTDVAPTEECISEAVKKLASDKKEFDMRTEEYERRVKQLTEQLNQELSLHRGMAQRAKRFETDATDMAERLRSAEGVLAAGDVLRDGFKFDKEKYLRGLQKLGEIMKMDRISLDLGLDLTMDALIARAEQLTKLEVDALANKSSHVYNLQRKVKALKEQLESKELHIDLLRKKITSLEERLHDRGDLIKDRDTENLRVRKLEKLIEKYKLQVQDSRHEVQNLKAQLLGSSDLKVHTLEQRKDIEELAKQIEELEDVRKHQSRKISSLKNSADNTESELQEKRLASENAVQALSSELRTTKNALETLKYREKQLVDFRTVVARMLGLEIETLAIPDYEIISRLEKLIQAHHTTAFTTLSLEEALEDAHVGGGYAPQVIEVTDPVVRHSRQRSRRRASRLKGRARSMSPMRRDTRAY